MSSELDKVQRMLSSYNFEVNNEDLTCVMCKRLMIDVHQTSCGCNYCHECILDYLNGENKKCKGSKKECQEEYLVMNENVTRNVKLNKDISRLKVRCPNKPCTFNKELTEMEDHLEDCAEKPTECPFFVVGCNLERERQSKIIEHLHQEQYDHSVKFLKVVEDLKYALRSLEEESRKKEDKLIKEMENMKEEIKKNENKVENQGKMLEDVLNITKEIKEDSTEKETQIIHLINEVESLKEELNTKDWSLFTKGEYQEDSRSSFITLKEDCTKKGETTKKNVNQSIEESEKRMDRLNEKIDTLYLRTNVRVGEILFRVDRFSERKTSEEKVFSPYFYSHLNGYKLRLKIYPAGFGDGKGTHLSLRFVICKGEYDDELWWPCRRSIKLSVVNQSTGDDHVSWTLSHAAVGKEFKHSFNKPIDKDNIPFGFPSFISHRDLQKVTLNDVVLVRASVSPR